MASFAPRLLLAKDRATTPWRNGAGTAADVASGPEGATPDDFDWRVSIATIEADADFSSYPGIQRYLMPLSTTGLMLTVDGETRVLPGFEEFEFAGESVTRAIDVTANTLDLNLMVRRRSAQGRLTAHAVDGAVNVAAAPNETVVIVMLDAAFGLAYLDAVELQPDSNLNLEGSGVIAIARITHDTLS